MSAYILGERCAETPWYELYEARKVFFNYRYHERRLYEAGEDEWIDVLVRLGPAHAADDDLPIHRQLLQYQARQVLAAGVPWFAEPLDWLEITPAAAGGSATQRTSRLPALVMARCHGQSLRQWRRGEPPGSPATVRVAAELLEMLSALHERGQVIGGFSPDDFLIDESGRIFFLATDRIMPARQSAELRRFFPPARYPTAFAASEVHELTACLDMRSDLYSWAALCSFLGTGNDPPHVSVPESGWGESARGAIETWLTEVAGRDPGALWELSGGRGWRSSARTISRWCRGVAQCLAIPPQKRPASVADLRRGVR